MYTHFTLFFCQVNISLKMMQKIFPLLVFFSLSCFALQAQILEDALRFSDFQVGGTARSIGAGGALGALGADFSVLSTNPAGLAWYRRSRFLASPSLYNARTDATLLNDPNGLPVEDNRANFNLNAFGLVFATPKASPKWRTINVGLGVNRIANFNQNLTFDGQSVGSIVERFQDQANSVGFLPTESDLAFLTGAVYDFNEDGRYDSDVELAPDAILQRSQTVERRGAINELVFSVAGNFREKLMLGATVGVPFVRFEENKTYLEDDSAGDDVPFYEGIGFSEELLVTGAGFNFKLGMVYRATQGVRVGLAVHTPTGFSLNEDYSTSMNYSFLDGDMNVQSLSEESEELTSNYNLSTPWRFIGSLGFIISKQGFLSAEVEHVNYAGNSFSIDENQGLATQLNQDVNSLLGRAWNLRFGGEFAYEIFRFRAGYRLQDAGFEADDSNLGIISAGLGLRQKAFFLDLAYQHFLSTENTYVPYLAPTAARDQVVDIERGAGQLVLTAGFTF
jgi:long-subunit fatty acid transport protein